MSGSDELNPNSIGPYKVLRVLGRGATATVYLCSHPERSDVVAVKLVRFSQQYLDEGKLNRRLLKLFRTEWDVAQKLDHPNIVKVFDYAVEPTQAYLVMEYFNGESLDAFCKFDRLPDVQTTISIVFKCAMALDYAFRRGVVHRDIKPANILVDKKFDVRLMDFGLALNVLKKSDADSTFVMGVGSPTYMSPEQIKDYPLNQQTDLYSLGVVLFQLLTGRQPFHGRNQADLVYKIINTDPPSVSQLNPAVPAEMDVIVRKALEKDLYARYRSGSEFAQDISGARFQMAAVPGDRAQDAERYAVLRRLPFFAEFQDVELWEVLCLSAWRKVGEGALIIREGDTEGYFGLILDGAAEVSLNGRRINTLGPGEAMGEMAYLDPFVGRRSATVIATAPMTYNEISVQALALASEELREHFSRRLIAILGARLVAADRRLAEKGPLARPPVASTEADDDWSIDFSVG
jgi:tRNA A-37 threonylcarbamoyl transferase component Bud32